MTASLLTTGPGALDDPMRIGTHNGHLFVAALKRHRDKPVIHLGQTTLTGGEVAQRISQYIQAFEALDAGTGTAGGPPPPDSPPGVVIPWGGRHPGGRR